MTCARGSLGVILGLAASLATPACRRPGAQVPVTDATGTPLPARLGGFAGGPLVIDPAARRRAYSRGGVAITVTLAAFAMTAEQYEGWVRASVDGFPQATAVVPPEVGNGFYQCGPGPTPTCDLLIQLRSGVHVEVRGGGTSRRADVDEVARGLSLRALDPAQVTSSGDSPS